MTRKIKITKRLLLFLPLLLISGLTSLRGQEIAVSADFSPPIIRAGESAVYRVDFQVEGRGLNQFPFDPNRNIPSVPGLQFNYLGPSQNIQIINGRTSMRLSYQYRVTAREVGDYQIPERTAQAGKHSFQIPAASLQVLEPSKVTDSDHLYSLELVLPRESLYIGEAVPIEIKLLVRRGVQAGLASERPAKIGDAFLIGDITPPVEQMVQRGDNIYHEVTWYAMITPIRSGDLPLTFNQDIIVTEPREQQNRHSRDPFDDLFGSAFSDSFFGRAGTRRQVSLYTADETIRILPLPEQGKPVSFTGGIGQFSVRQPTLSTSKVQAGEPVTLTVVVEGTGNFDRMQAPELEQMNEWRYYPPTESFQASDKLGYRGSKTFEYILIPRSEGIRETPVLAFSFFDPRAEEYRTIQPATVALEVTPAPPGTAMVADGQRVAEDRGPELLPIRLSPGKIVGFTTPLVRNPAFVASQLIPLALLIGLCWIKRQQRRLETDSVYAHRFHARKAVLHWLKEASKAASDNQPDAFYNAAIRSIQESVARPGEQKPEAQTGNEVVARMASMQTDEQTRNAVQSFFDKDEAYRFSGSRPSHQDLKKDKQLLDQTLQSLEEKRS